MASVLSGDLVKLGSSAAVDPVALASLVLTELANIVSVFNGHTHVNGTGPAVPQMVAPSPVGASKTLAE